jgi:O-antigen/teichoic acid export membrane protein
MINSIQKYISAHQTKLKQVLFLFGSNILVLIIGLFIKNIQTNELTPEDYGNYAFFTSITGFLVTFYRFGFFSSIQVLLSESKDVIKSRELAGIAFILALVIGALFSMSIFLLSFIIDPIFNTQIGDLTRLASILCFPLVFKFAAPAVAIGSNKIGNLAFFESFSRIIYLITIVAFPYLNIKLNTANFILLNLGSLALAMFIFILQFKPLFSNIKTNFIDVWIKTKTFGFQLYVGQSAQQSTYKFDELFITYFINATQLGYYSLAKFIAMPMVFMSQAITSSLYKSFATAKKISNQTIYINLVWLVGCIVFLYFAGGFIVEILLGKEYLTTIDYIVPISFAYLFQGLYQPYSFLSAKSKGKELRNTSLIETFVNIFGNLLLIPIYGVMGAILATVLSKFIQFITLRYYYHQYLKNEIQKELTSL